MSNGYNDAGLFLNAMLSYMVKKIVVPTEFHEQVRAVKLMLQDDVTGLVDSLTDLAVNSASVDFSIETSNSELNKILEKWLKFLNIGYNGQILTGIIPLAEEYFKERWKSSSFPVLKISEWSPIDGILVPTKMFFVDGGSVYAEDKSASDETSRKLINYDYYLGREKEEKLDDNVLITKPYGRNFDKYPTPFLIKRGIYHNWKIIQSIKNKETEILEQIIPYLFLVKKGTEALAVQKDVRYDDPKLTKVLTEFQELMDKMNNVYNSSKGGIQSPMRVTQFDEEIKHLIPDLSTIFNRDLFAVAEQNILAGLGFVDVVEAVSTSRRESILNPKAFIEEVNKGVKDFRQILKELVLRIVAENAENHPKYMKADIFVSASPVKTFMTDDFKEKLRQLYDRGRLSSQTAIELIGEVDFKTEWLRRKRETRDGVEVDLYPPVRQNREDTESVEEVLHRKPFTEDVDVDNIPEDKTDEVERQEYDVGNLEAPVKCSKCSNIFDYCAEVEITVGVVECPKCGNTVTKKRLFKKKDLEIAPYKTIKELPSRVKNSMTEDLQRVFVKVFNNAFDTYNSESRAFAVAWSVIRRIGRKNKKDIWVRKRKRAQGRLVPVKLTRGILEKVVTEEVQKTIEEATKQKKKEVLLKQEELLDLLLNKGKK